MRYILTLVVFLVGNILFGYELVVSIRAGGIPDIISAALLPLGLAMSTWLPLLILIEGHLHRHGGR